MDASAVGNMFPPMKASTNGSVVGEPLKSTNGNQETKINLTDRHNEINRRRDQHHFTFGSDRTNRRPDYQPSGLWQNIELQVAKSNKNPFCRPVDADGDVAMLDADDKKATDLINRSHGGASWCLVIDTNFIMAHLQVVNDLVTANAKWGSVVLIPWATIMELDGLKKSNGYQDSPNGDRVSTGALARRANSWALENIKAHGNGLWGQKKEEVLEANGAKGDEAILDCCRYFHEKRGIKTALLSNDVNFCLRANLYEIVTVSFGDKPMSAENIMESLAGPPKASTSRAYGISSSSSIELAASGANGQNYHIDQRRHRPKQESWQDEEILERLAALLAHRDPSCSNAYNRRPLSNTEFNANRFDDHAPSGRNPFDSIISGNNPFDGNNRSNRYTFKPGNSLSQRNQFHGSGYRINKNYLPRRNNSSRYDKQSKRAVQVFLENAQTDIVHILSKLLDQHATNTLTGSLDINPARTIQSLSDLEDYLTTYWHTIFAESFLNSSSYVDIIEGKELSTDWLRWMEWTCGAGGKPPMKLHIRYSIGIWYLIGTNLDENSAETSDMDKVSHWWGLVDSLPLLN